jgi:hypothetical protein
VTRCACGSRAAWRVTIRETSYSSFNGYNPTPSASSLVHCEPEEGGCGAAWTTRAKYVAGLPSSTRYGREAGRNAPRSAAEPNRTVDHRLVARVCEACRRPGTADHPLTVRRGRVFHGHEHVAFCDDREAEAPAPEPNVAQAVVIAQVARHYVVDSAEVYDDGDVFVTAHHVDAPGQPRHWRVSPMGVPYPMG